MNIQVPFRLLIAGPSQSGKTCFTKKFIEHLPTWSGKSLNIIWCVGDEASIPQDMDGVTFVVGIPSQVPPHSLLVLDDLMKETGKNDDIAELFTRGSHHRDISVILITQNFFHKSKNARDISLNATYVCLTKNPRDPSQFFHLCRQVYPANPSSLHNAYKEIMKESFGHLFMDFSQTTSDYLRFKSNIFDTFITVYAPVGEDEKVKIV